jgi:hypothetical protein
MNLEEWIVVPGDRALRSALGKADSIDNQPPTVVDYQKKERMNQYIDGRLQMSIPIQPRQRVEKESLITRIKNKIKW